MNHSIYTDKEERIKTLEQKVKELTERQTAIDQHSLVAITDINGIILHVNEKFSKICQYSKQELIGKNYRIINSKYHSKYFFQHLFDTIQAGNIWHGEIRNISKSKKIFWVNTTIIPLISGTSENKNQYIVLGTDISEQKKIQEELIAAKIFANSVTDSVSAHICVLNKIGEILSVNKAWRDFYFQNGTEREINWLGINYLKLCDTARGPEANDAIVTANGIRSVMLSQLDEFVHEYPCHSPTEKRWFSIRVTRFHDNSGNIVIAHELITQRKLAEEEIQRYTKELESLNQTKDKFFNIIAHDLRNPFSGIISVSEMLESKITAEGNEVFLPLKKFVELIYGSSKSAFSLLENLMQWAKSQTGNIKFDPIILSIKKTINANLPLIETNAIAKNISIQNKIELDDLVIADEIMLNTVLRNLITNAIKFTYTNGEIIITSEESGEFLQINVADSGTGISPENLEKLFRIDSKFTKNGTGGEKGTGLGLILCKEFIEIQGGQIWAKSEIGKGSVFTFTLPLATHIDSGNFANSKKCQ
ncbi:MAG: PAS domain-containing sensor histidine kinase [Leptospiraceae bacterium]|nr:PAS domain-containing sensor histidine kinase [Leptospiraceae bacterium]